MNTLHLDFETRSPVDLKAAGTYVYGSCRSTQILCVGYAWDQGPAAVVAPENLPPQVLEHIRRGGRVVAHNASFELVIWNWVGVREYGWPKLSASQMSCTMARAFRMGLPGSLEQAAAALGLAVQKDMGGRRLMLVMCKPQTRIPGGCKACEGRGRWSFSGPCDFCMGTGEGYTWRESPEDLRRLGQYCVIDVEVEQELDERLLELSPFEKKVWVLDQRINARGVGVDVPNAERAIKLVEAEQDRLDEKMRRLTGNQVATTRAHIQLKEWVNGQGVKTEGVAKDDVFRLLERTDLPSVVRDVLEVRQEAAKSSTAKLRAMVVGANSDGRLRGMFQYHGASTGRWAGRRVQLQNIPRPKLTHVEICRAMRLFSRSDAAEIIDIHYGPVMGVISECLRSFLRAGPGHDLIAGDWNAIEARTLAWLAGESRVLDTFAKGGKIYEAQAADIFAVALSNVNSWQRLVGKVAILALGYQGGVGAFQTMAKVYQVSTAPAFHNLWARAGEDIREKVKRAWEERGRGSGVGKKEWFASELIKIFWREANPNIVGYWHSVERAAIGAVLNPGKTVSVGPEVSAVKWRMEGSFLFCRLPSGRAICYPYPEIKEVETPWGEKRPGLRYKTYDSATKKFVRVAAYGGLLVENITQAVARDLLAAALVRLEERKFQVVMHVHDEVVVEVLKGNDALEDRVRRIMEELPPWAQGLPVKVETWRGERYRK